MEAIMPNLKVNSLNFTPSIIVTKKSPLDHYGCLRLKGKNGDLGRLKCAKSGIVPELEGDIKVEEELNMIGSLKGKCRESNGVAELLECLEKEAIMGDDQGKEATDYNRRALIFDQSNRVFQAIKQRDSPKE